MACTLVAIGVWMLADGIYSLNVYLNAPVEWREGNHKQTWFRDHWIRVIRVLLGIYLVVLGYMG